MRLSPRQGRMAALGLGLLALTACGSHPTNIAATDVSRQLTPAVADAALTSGAPDFALRVANLILQRDPHDVAALTAKGDALYAMSQAELAGAAYRQAIALDPKAAQAEIGLGRVLARSDPKAAEGAFLAALAADPMNATALSNLGLTRDLQGRHSEAQTAYRMALAAQPGMTEAQVNLGMSLALSGDAQAGLRMLWPLASQPGASQTARDDLALATQMAGNAAGAQQLVAQDKQRRGPDVVMASQTESPPLTATPVATAAPPALPPMPPTEPLVVMPAPLVPVVREDAPAPAAVAPQIVVMPRAVAVPGRDVAVASANPEAQPILSPSRMLARIDLPRSVAPPMPIISSPAPPSDPVPAPASLPEATPAVAVAPVAAAAAVAQLPPMTVAMAPRLSHAEGRALAAQLASLNTRRGATLEWHRLQGRMPELLQDRTPLISPADVHGRQYWRLRTGGFTSPAEAGTFCTQVHARGTDCWVGS